uniref:Uncharacterized protein n=1 Tax=Nelumbo nucifera TaxID=4432 RepID=A0A822YED9_NELNU|nr:TPA_asm: hypothetical protein HUJ06_009718 [Nelumbo nucifera]
MDLETENQIAAILMKDAAELRRQAEKEGVLAYLRQPKVRGRPNARFLTATVLGVQQANRAAEVNEMWRVRQKELELDDRLKERSRDKSSSRRKHGNYNGFDKRKHGDCSDTVRRHEETGKNVDPLCTSSKRVVEECYSSDEGSLRDEEVEEFLHSRVKRGRGAVGSRLDDRLKERSRDKSSSRRKHGNYNGFDKRKHGDCSDTVRRHEETGKNVDPLCTSSKRVVEECYSSDEGSLRDEEVEEFLHSRVKRGRGAVGSRVDETGPYLQPSSCSNSKDKLLASSDVRLKEEWEHRVLGPEKPSFLKSHESSEDEPDRKISENSKKHHSKSKHLSKKDKCRKKKKEQKSKHRHRS